MHIRIAPYEQIRNGKSYFYVTIHIDKKKITQLAAPDSVTNARKLGEEIAEKLRTGVMTVEELKNRPLVRPHKQILGKSLTQWLEHFKVTRGAIYKAARNKGYTVEQEIWHRLSPVERKETGAENPFPREEEV